MKILIAHDGSEYADRAVEDLQRAGLPRKADAVILSVADVFMPPAPLEEYEHAETVWDERIRVRAQELSRKAAEAVKQAHGIARRAIPHVQESFPGWVVNAEAQGDSPVQAIVNKADEWGADLIVVGSHGRSAPGRFFLGSISQKVLNESRCSVRIGRKRSKDKAADAPLRIIIGIDGSPGADDALAAVASRNWPHGTEVCVIAVLDVMMATFIHWVEEGDDSEEAWIRRVVEAATEKLRRAGLEASSKIENGDAARVLTHEAERWGADSIFIGARGLRGVARLLLGSVSSAVAVRAHCSVEVVRSKQPA